MTDNEKASWTNRPKTRDLFCRCCRNYFKRDNVTFLHSDGEDAVYYQLYGMCKKCYEEVNPGRDEVIQELNKEKNLPGS